MNWLNHVKELNRILNGLSVLQCDGAETSIDEALLLWEKTTLSIRDENKPFS